MPRNETQKTIAEWADEAFGPAPSIPRLAARANEEMAELLREVTFSRDSRECVYEAADVVIALYRLAEVCGADLDFVVDKKMEMNRWLRGDT